MAKALTYCVPCGEERRDVLATAEIDGDPVCAMHARIAAAVEAGWAKPTKDVPLASGRSPLPGAICSRGCGNAPHRGRCVGPSRRAQKTAAPILPEPVSIVESFGGCDLSGVNLAAKDDVSKIGSEKSMDTLVCEEIPASEVPSGRERNIGRLGEMWTRLMATPFDVALKVKCRDADHAGSTARHMTLKARKAGVAIVSRRVGDSYFCYRVRPDVQR